MARKFGLRRYIFVASSYEVWIDQVPLLYTVTRRCDSVRSLTRANTKIKPIDLDVDLLSNPIDVLGSVHEKFAV